MSMEDRYRAYLMKMSDTELERLAQRAEKHDMFTFFQIIQHDQLFGPESKEPFLPFGEGDLVEELVQWQVWLTNNNPRDTPPAAPGRTGVLKRSGIRPTPVPGKGVTFAPEPPANILPAAASPSEATSLATAPTPAVAPSPMPASAAPQTARAADAEALTAPSPVRSVGLRQQPHRQVHMWTHLPHWCRQSGNSALRSTPIRKPTTF